MPACPSSFNIEDDIKHTLKRTYSLIQGKPKRAFFLQNINSFCRTWPIEKYYHHKYYHLYGWKRVKSSQFWVDFTIILYISVSLGLFFQFLGTLCKLTMRVNTRKTKERIIIQVRDNPNRIYLRLQSKSIIVIQMGKLNAVSMRGTLLFIQYLDMVEILEML